MRNLILAAAIVGAVIAVSAAGRADEVAAAPVTDAEVRKAITAFAKAWRKRDTEARVAAVRTLGNVDHAKAADRLFKILGKTDDAVVQVEAYQALAKQTSSAKDVARKLATILRREAKAAQKRIRKGDLGFRLDPRTGQADVDSEEGMRALAESESRSRRMHAVLAAYRALSEDPPDDADDLTILLQDPYDALVVETLGAFARWQTQDALLSILDLYRMYPEENRWETGEVVQGGGTDATAKAEWMTRFGHPSKHTHRPLVVQALRAALEELTGEAQGTPEALETWMQAQGMRTN